MKGFFLILYFIIAQIAFAQNPYTTEIRIENLYWKQYIDNSPEWICDSYADLYLNGDLVEPSNDYSYLWYGNSTGSFQLVGNVYHINPDGMPNQTYQLYVVVSGIDPQGNGFETTSNTIWVGLNESVQNVIVKAQLANGTNLAPNDYLQLFINPDWVGPAYHTQTQTWKFMLTQDDEAIIRTNPFYLESYNQKFNRWNSTDQIINFGTFYIDGDFTQLITHFSNIIKNVTIRSNYSDFVNEDIVGFKDPWLVDKFVSENLGMQNRGDLAPFKYYNIIDFTDQNFDDYLGVFKNQNPQFDPTLKIYSVSIPSSVYISQTGKYHDIYLINWIADPPPDADFKDEISSPTDVVFKNDGVTITANVKGQGLSADPTTYTKGGERKIVRTPGFGAGSTLHRVYQDMGYVWYETSTDNGQTWSLRNEAQALGDGGLGKNPSIDWVYMSSTFTLYVVVAYQQPNSSGGYDIYFDIFGDLILDNPASLPRLAHHSVYHDNGSYTFDANPVVSITPNSDNLTAHMDIVWQNPAGLYLQGVYIDADRNNNPLFNLAPGPVLIDNTNSNSINPSIGVTKLNYNGTFGLAWEENNTIKYRTINGGTFGSISTISDYDGYAHNHNPSLVMLEDNSAQVCWKGERYIVHIDPTTKTDNSFWERRTIFRGDAVSEGHFWYFGENVGNPNINKSDAEDYYAIIWNQGENSTYFTDNNLSTPREVDNFPGSSVQVSNGPTKNQMYADVFNTQTTPYYFKTTSSLGSYYIPNKITGYSFSSGREGVIAKDTAQFYFAIGDIKADGSSIDFVAIPDSIAFNSKEILNNYLVSEPFQLNDNSTFLYSIQYGITDSSAAANLLSNPNRYISFKLQLIDAQTSEILGTYDEVIYDQSNIYQYNNLSYQVNTAGIGARDVYLRLVTDNNFDPGYSLGEIYSAGDILQKTTLKTTNYDGLKSVETYDLSQNYPNPFNPATTINYQLPQTGFVTLKIYDILGKEVATLVNEQKNQGRYWVKFDASKLASGVYIYRLTVNDYVSSKKMLLIK